MRRKNKRGIMILSDLMWFLIFVICATLIFVFLYHPLNKQAQARGVTAFDGTALSGDAQYMAYVLPQLPAHLSANIDPAFAQVSASPTPVLSDLIAVIARENAAGRDFTNNNAYQLYSTDLNNILTSKTLLDTPKNKFGKTLQKYSVQRVSVLLRMNGKTIDVANCDKTLLNNKFLCDVAIPDRDDYVSAQEFAQKELGCPPNLLGCIDKNIYYEIGWTHIPTADGVVTLEVITTHVKGGNQ